MTGQKLKGGTGGLLSEIVSKAVTPVGTIAGNVVYRVGQGLEFIGKAGAKTLDEVLGLSKNQVLNIPTNTQPTQTTTSIKKSVSNIKESVPQTTNKASGKMSGFAQILKETTPGKVEGKMLKEDMLAIKDFIKVFKGESKVPDSTYLAMRQELKGIAKAYGVNRGTSDIDLIRNLVKKINADKTIVAKDKIKLGMLPKLAIGSAIGAGGIAGGAAYIKSKK